MTTLKFDTSKVSPIRWEQELAMMQPMVTVADENAT